MESVHGPLLHVYGGCFIDLLKSWDSAAVVPVPMGNKGMVYPAQVQAQVIGIVYKGLVRSCVKEQCLVTGFNEKAESVFGGQAGCGTVGLGGPSIFNEAGDFHFAPWYIRVYRKK